MWGRGILIDFQPRHEISEISRLSWPFKLYQSRNTAFIRLKRKIESNGTTEIRNGDNVGSFFSMVNRGGPPR